MADVISVKNLSHSYNEDENFAVKNISFEVAKGETFGFFCEETLDERYFNQGRNRCVHPAEFSGRPGTALQMSG